MGRTVIVILWTIWATIYYGLAMIVFTIVFKGRSFHRISQLWAESLVRVAGIRVRISGRENVTPGQPYIFMSNHQSNFDIPVLLAYIPVEFKWLAKAELFRIPLFGRAMLSAGYIPIDRSDRKSAFASLAKAANNIHKGTSVIIFPEGTRSPGEFIQPFKKGGFVLAVDSQVPIIPVIIYGTQSIMPKKQLVIHPGQVFMRFGRPIDTTEYTRKTKDDLLEVVRYQIQEEYERLKRGFR